MRYVANFLLVLVMPLMLLSCSKDKSAVVDLPKYKEMKNINEAPEALKQAARAIVKFEMYDGSTGTATFISPDGLVLTNNHVLGVDNTDESFCAAEGCYVKIHVNYQTGNKYELAIDVFAEPIQVNPEADVAVYQLWKDGSKTQKFAAPHYLSFDFRTAGELQNRSVNIIGHPLGSVKKWSSGQVFKQQGNWFYATNYTLPGNSGSPHLSDEAKIIGIHHRASEGNHRVTPRDVLYHAIGTASSELRPVLNGRARLNLFYSIQQRHSNSEIAEHHGAYLMAHTNQVTLVGGRKSTVLDVLAQECDDILKKTDFLSPDDLDKKLASCSKSFFWLNCRKPEDGVGYKSCPVGAEKNNWKARYFKATELAQAFNSNRLYRWLVSPSRLESKDSSLQVSSALLRGYLARTNPPLNFEIADALLDTGRGHANYAGNDVGEFVKNFRNQSNYQFQYDWIIWAHETLYDWDVLSKEAFAAATNSIFGDEKLDLGNKLRLESMAYKMGLL